MKEISNAHLADYTTIKIGGIAKLLVFPATLDELIETKNRYPNAPILGGGSNLLINDTKEYDCVICLREFLLSELVFESTRIRVGGGVRLQKLIKYINENGYGGIEYLWSVPGLVGGAILMNAGRGRSANKQISDYLISVDVLENGVIKTYKKRECGFDYRTSRFKESSNCIIVSAIFEFEKIDPEEGLARRKERIEMCKAFQDSRYPNAGTAFCKSDPRILNLMKCFSSKNSNSGIHFSDKTANWLQNRGNGTFRMAMKRLNYVIILHKLFHKDCKLEYIIWK